MFESFTFWLCVLVGLVAYLCVSVELRWRAEEARRRSHEKVLPGTSFDVSTIAPQIQRLRRDPVAALHSQPHPASQRIGLIAAAQQMVTGLSYFRHARSEHELEKHDA